MRLGEKEDTMEEEEEEEEEERGSAAAPLQLKLLPLLPHSAQPSFSQLRFPWASEAGNVELSMRGGGGGGVVVAQQHCLFLPDGVFRRGRRGRSAAGGKGLFESGVFFFLPFS
ncbi:hypothetical protein ZIOFF_037757 [Zingiber officinale]|uniref:Uncharacterized protein n=1 Tax=Zingiber officinale TaxID=94328 RepID=A0A8J5GDM3_ZINOF|nr:hypothetical protein ZIOFF_037757 [Zingiber officinale]